MRLESKEHNEDLIKLIEEALETNNTKVSREHVDAAIDKPNNNLMLYHNGRLWDVPEKFMFPKIIFLKHG